MPHKEYTVRGIVRHMKGGDDTTLLIGHDGKAICEEEPVGATT